jgi:5-(carboxyamino)imidazole ribonucleotide synthase
MTPPLEPRALPPGSVVGILGGGQLGRMLALAAAPLGLRCHVFTPSAACPAAQACDALTVAAFDDTEALARFASAVSVVTYEFENVPARTAEFLAARVPVRPSPRALAICQDRFEEKSFLRSAGAATADFRAVDELDGLHRAVAAIGLPAVLKTRRLGYDGKGQAAIRADADIAAGWAAIGQVPAILEVFVAFDCELSVIAARGLDGDVACYDPALNVHENHVLARSTVPAPVTAATAAAARAIAATIVRRLDYVGIMGVELFLSGGAEPVLHVNEIAPRVHNSGHWTQDACTVSQFEQHLRAVCGWPLGDPARHHDVIMENLLGAAAERWRDIAAEPNAALHLYGKDEVRAGRKMGHVNRLYPLGSGPPARKLTFRDRP